MVWNAPSDINYYESLLEERDKPDVRETIEGIDFQKLCRTCLRPVVDGCDLSKNYEIGAIPINVGGRHLQVLDMLIELISIKVETNDFLPHSVCNNCIQNVSGAYFFKLQCYKAEKTLLRLLEDNWPHSENCENTEDKAKSTSNDNDVVNEIEYQNSDSEQNYDEDVKRVDEIFIDVQEGKEDEDDSSQEFDGTVNIVEIEEEIVQKSSETNKLSIKCEECDLTFSGKKELLTHSRIVHAPKKVFECDICHSRCCNMQTLKRHMKIHQADQKNKMCTFCGKCFTRADDLKRHVRIHTGERPYACTMCPKSYKQTSELKEHMSTHSQGRVYVCAVCGKCLLTRNGHYVHMKAHLGLKNHVCRICNNKYVTSGELNSHMRHIHDKKKPFNCEIEGCQRKFSSKLSLTIHQRSHTGERPFICSTCGKGLATASSLADHIRTHTGEKKNVCNICNRGFSTAQSLKKHMRTHNTLQTNEYSDTPDDDLIKQENSSEEISEHLNENIDHQTKENEYNIVFMDGSNEVVFDESNDYTGEEREETVTITYFEN